MILASATVSNRRLIPNPNSWYVLRWQRLTNELTAWDAYCVFTQVDFLNNHQIEYFIDVSSAKD